jgi:hypothetical protein
MPSGASGVKLAWTTSPAPAPMISTAPATRKYVITASSPTTSTTCTRAVSRAPVRFTPANTIARPAATGSIGTSTMIERYAPSPTSENALLNTSAIHVPTPLTIPSALDWPELRFYVASPPGAERDVVLLAGVAPHLRWCCSPASPHTCAGAPSPTPSQT